jgi:hypothetical protein
MTDRLLLPPQVVGLDGRPIVGAQIQTYVSGTTTPKAVYADAALTIPHANPVLADAAGRFPAMFLAGGDYRVILLNPDGSTIATYDPVAGSSSASEATAAGAMRNRFLNPAMQISQERGTASLACTTGSAYVIDGWEATLSTTPGGTLTVAQVASVSPGGSPNRLRATVTVADATLAAGDFYTIRQNIEGVKIADARFGTASARQLLLRLGVQSSVAGTFSVSVRNSANNRSWLGTITVAPAEVGVAVTKQLTIPGDTAGTWLKDTGIGMRVTVCLASGTTFQGVPGWQTGSFIATSAQTNFMANTSATFDLFDVGLYVDQNASGVFPTWELPDFAAELLAAQRYWESSYDYGVVPGTATFAGAASGPTQNGVNVALISVDYRVKKRPGTITVTAYNPQTGTVGQMRDSAGTASAVSIGSDGEGGFIATNNNGTALAANSIAFMHWTANARL